MECAKQLNGSVCEGFVGRDRNFNRVKIKSPSYVKMHHNVKHSVADLIRIVMQNEDTEVATYFPDLQADLSRLRELYNQLASKGEEECSEKEIEERLLALFDQTNADEKTDTRISKAEKQKQKAARKELKMQQKKKK